jgi:hypothetical protein
MGAPVSSRKVIILLSSDLIRHTQITSSRTSTHWNATSPNITRATGGITRDSRTSRLNATYNQSRQRDQHTKESRRQQTPARQTIGESRSVGGSTCGLGPYDRCLRSIRQRGRTTVAGSTRLRERVFEDMDPGRPESSGEALPFVTKAPGPPGAPARRLCFRTYHARTRDRRICGPTRPTSPATTLPMSTTPTWPSSCRLVRARLWSACWPVNSSRPHPDGLIWASVGPDPPEPRLVKISPCIGRTCCEPTGLNST